MNKKTNFFVLGIASLLSFPLFSTPLPGIFLPMVGQISGLGSAASFTPFLEESHQSMLWNPAAAADRELPLYSFTGTLAFPTESTASTAGSLSGGALLPNALGVAWMAAEGLIASDELVPWSAPQGFSVATGLSKRGSDLLSLGLGLGTAYLPDLDPSWTLCASLGVQAELPKLGPLGSSLALSLLGLGPRIENLIIPSPMATLTTVFRETSKLRVSTAAFLAFPDFQDIAAGIGASFALGPVNVDVSWMATIRQLQEWNGGDNPNYTPSPLPSIALRFNAASFLKIGSYGAAPKLGVRFLGEGVLAADIGMSIAPGERDQSGPDIKTGPLEQNLISPLIQDTISVPIELTDQSRITGWEALVVDPKGLVVHRERTGVEEHQKSGILSQLLRVRRSVPYPDELKIPVTEYTDGTYTLRFSAEDERGNKGRAADLSFTIDGTAPSASCTVIGPGRFSPNGDGIRDVLTIDQNGSPEILWTGTFMDAQGKLAAQFRWEDGSPLSFVWDGKDDQGQYLGDGVYTYNLQSLDEAGNNFSISLENIIIDAAPTGATLTLNNEALSTDPSASKGSIQLGLAVSRPEAVQEWTISIIDAGAVSLRSWKGRAANLDSIPSSILFNGRTDRGDPLQDGRYRFRIDLRYLNGDTPSAISDTFTIDSRKPSGKVRAGTTTIVLDRNQRTILYHDLSPWASWTGIIKDGEGRKLRGYSIPGGTEGTAEWNGVDDDGNPVAEGTYTYHAEGTSSIGISGQSNEILIRVESGGFELALMAEGELFSAIAGEGRLRFYPRIARRDRVLSYSLLFRDSGTKKELRRFEGRAPVPAAIPWDGRDEFDTPVPDGSYEALLSVRFDGGSAASEIAQALPITVSVDSTPPALSVKAEHPLFSPNKDGNLDIARFNIESSGEASWRAELRDDAKRLVKSFVWNNQAPRILNWDGTDGMGRLFRDGSYYLWVEGTDAAGNRTVAQSEGVILDARIPAAVIGADKTAFSPNGDGFADTVGLRLIPSFLDGLASWKVLIRDSTNQTIRIIASGTDTTLPPGTFLWDGKNDRGAKVSDGQYTPYAELRYHKGDIVETEGTAFHLDTTVPRIRIMVQPQPFSPDGDGIDDLVYLGISAEDSSPIDAWMLTILDPAGMPFTLFSGRQLPETPLSWDGRDLDGNLVEAAQDYPYTLKVRDVLGNMAEKRGIISTDVFILRDGDKLKIRISSIVFPPNSSSLISDNQEITARNTAILDRIAVVLAKYPTYQIRIEGHAVNISGTEREERTELDGLSLSRAQAVLDALVTRRVSRTRMEAKGLGGREPLVPHGDLEARWRNRRVEFILMR